MLDQLIAELTDAECTCCSKPGQPCAYCTAMDRLVEHARETERLLYRILDYQQAGFGEHHARRRAFRDRAANSPLAYERITHGRHCACTPCARQDWTDPRLAPCGMHGTDCPPRYEPFGAAGQLAAYRQHERDLRNGSFVFTEDK